MRHLPDLSEGMSFNLANNIWGTNYIMWQPYSGLGATMRFRFEISSELMSGHAVNVRQGQSDEVAAS